LLDEAELGVVEGDWDLVRTRVEQALRLDPANADAGRIWRRRIASRR
jgi:hypothetical protein